MSALWLGLLANFAVVAIILSVWVFCHDWIAERTRTEQSLIVGLFLGGGTVVLMHIPFELEQGVFVDLRNSLIAISGFFAGPLAGVITGAASAISRTAIGGIGAPAGVVSTTVATVIGIAGHGLLRGRTPRRADILVLAAAVAPGSLLSLFAWPTTIWAATIPIVALPLGALIFVTTLLVGLAIHQEGRRREAMNANLMYRAIIEALPDSLNAKDLEGRFLAANPATARLMQAASPEALVGRTDFEFYPKEAAKSFRADEEQALRDGRTTMIEQHFAQADGSVKWLWTLKVPFRNRSGTIIGLVTHNRDITDWKRLQGELAESRLQLETMAKTDGLTGLLNRRAFDEALEREMARRTRAASTVSLLMIDVDRFKSYNDIYGHPAGDEGLRLISRCLRETLTRSQDITARYGGEELAAILPDTEMDGALHVAEKFRRAVHELNIAHQGSEHAIVTVSVGVATAAPNSSIADSLELIRRADMALYGAKAAGRDRVHGWRPQLESARRA